MTDIPNPPPSAFGGWLACTDDRAHYRLGDAFLRGAAPEPTGAPVTAQDGRKTLKVLVPYCPACRTLNGARWAALGGAA